MRGKVPQFYFSQIVYRITPAYAGKSRRAWLFCLGLKGSPPPMRGKDVEFEVNADGSRITPAYAGKSIGKPSAATTTQDHPRLCGEKFHNFIFHKLFIGSPPPMRGKAAERGCFVWG